MFNRIARDIRAIQERDPALKSIFELWLCYPGFHALLLHRVSHKLYQMGLFTFARLISQLTRFLTGIEIHPGAQIGSGVFIDHGMGVVIGETAVIHDNVTLYQGVVLGGTGKERGKRHPTIEEGVVIACGAKVLGSFIVGKNSRIGAGAVVLQSVPPHSTVVGVPGRVVVQDGQRVDKLCHDQLPDPINKCITDLERQIEHLQNQVLNIEKHSKKIS